MSTIVEMTLGSDGRGTSIALTIDVALVRQLDRVFTNVDHRFTSGIRVQDGETSRLYQGATLMEVIRLERLAVNETAAAAVYVTIDALRAMNAEAGPPLDVVYGKIVVLASDTIRFYLDASLRAVQDAEAARAALREHTADA